MLLIQVALQSGHRGQPGWLRVASALLECLAALALAAANDAKNRLRLMSLMFPAQSVAQADDHSPLFTIVLAVCEEAVAATHPTSATISEQPKSSPHDSLTSGQTASAVLALMNAAEALAALAADSCHRSATDGDGATAGMHRDSLHRILGALVAPPGGLLVAAVQHQGCASLGTTFSAPLRLKALATTAAIFNDAGVAPNARFGGMDSTQLHWNGLAMRVVVTASCLTLTTCVCRQLLHIHPSYQPPCPLTFQALSESVQRATGERAAEQHANSLRPPSGASCPALSQWSPLCTWNHTVQQMHSKIVVLQVFGLYRY